VFHRVDMHRPTRELRDADDVLRAIELRDADDVLRDPMPGAYTRSLLSST